MSKNVSFFLMYVYIYVYKKLVFETRNFRKFQAFLPRQIFSADKAPPPHFADMTAKSVSFFERLPL